MKTRRLKYQRQFHCLLGKNKLLVPQQELERGFWTKNVYWKLAKRSLIFWILKHFEFPHIPHKHFARHFHLRGIPDSLSTNRIQAGALGCLQWKHTRFGNSESHFHHRIGRQCQYRHDTLCIQDCLNKKEIFQAHKKSFTRQNYQILHEPSDWS